MTQANDNNSNQPVTKESMASLERAKDSKTAIIFFLSLIIVALIGCLGAEHLGYIALKDCANTTSADDINGQNPANTYVNSGTAGADVTPPSTPAGTTANSAGGNSPNVKATSAPAITTTAATPTPAATAPAVTNPPAVAPATNQ